MPIGWMWSLVRLDENPARSDLRIKSYESASVAPSTHSGEERMTGVNSRV